MSLRRRLASLLHTFVRWKEKKKKRAWLELTGRCATVCFLIFLLFIFFVSLASLLLENDGSGRDNAGDCQKKIGEKRKNDVGVGEGGSECVKVLQVREGRGTAR